MNLLRADTKFPNTVYMIRNPYDSYGFQSMDGTWENEEAGAWENQQPERHTNNANQNTTIQCRNMWRRIH